MDQKHLNDEERVTLGSYYTKPELVALVGDLLRRHVPDSGDYVLADTSCGYGAFLSQLGVPCRRMTGADVDAEAVKQARRLCPSAVFIRRNGLWQVRRSGYRISRSERLIIVGNPPYNDRTSQVRNAMKRGADKAQTDTGLATRDLGMSFLLSYNKLSADWVCVLHPLAYLIKPANFRSLGAFAANYRLTDAVVFDSREFSQTAKLCGFPIVAALYRRVPGGMSFQDVEKFEFRTIEGMSFRTGDFESVGAFLDKYPNGGRVNPRDAVARFWPMRDINALRRNRTFLTENIRCANAVWVTRDLLEYYCYVDAFKQHIDRVPYYLGNCDVMISPAGFRRLRKQFLQSAADRHPQLRRFVRGVPADPDAEAKIERYFKRLLRASRVKK